MREGDRAAALRLLAQWNMAPIAPSAAIPAPERSALDPATSFVAVAAGAVVGVASFLARDADLAETASLAVDPAWRGRGVGKLLQERRLLEMRRRGFRQVRTEADRPEVIAWYKRHWPYVEAGSLPKRHAFGQADIASWTILLLDL